MVVLRTLSANISFVRGYAFKSDLKIKWVRPEKIPAYKPEKSGDMEKYNPAIDKSFILPEYTESKELATANDLVKRLFALEFAPRRRAVEIFKKSMVDAVKRHPLDTHSTEAKIARYTGNIRAMQEFMERFPSSKHVKIRLQELIDKRNKRLKYLRQWDYKKFEWLIEQLNIGKIMKALS